MYDPSVCNMFCAVDVWMAIVHLYEYIYIGHMCTGLCTRMNGLYAMDEPHTTDDQKTKKKLIIFRENKTKKKHKKYVAKYNGRRRKNIKQKQNRKRNKKKNRRKEKRRADFCRSLEISLSEKLAS